MFGCFLKRRNYGGSSFENEIATPLVDPELNTTEEIEICYDSDFTSEYNTCTEDEAIIDFCKSKNPDLAKQLQERTVFSEIDPSTTIFINNFDARSGADHSRCASLFNRSLVLLDESSDFVCAKSFPNPFVFNCSVFVWFNFIFTTPDRGISIVKDGNEAASIKSRRLQNWFCTSHQIRRHASFLVLATGC